MSLDPHIAPEIRKKFSPVSVNSDGLSGSYFLKNFEGEVIGIFKPKEQEFGMPLNPHGDDKPYDKDNPIEVQFYGHVQGTGWLKEVAASELSDDFMAEPYTIDFPILFPIPEKFAKEKGELCLQKGSFQKFAPNARTISEMTKKELETIPTEEIQKIALFDMLLVNGDRHLDNFLYDGKKIIPIDHGGCFLTGFDIRGEWLVMPQLKKPIDSKVLNWLNDFDIEASCKKLEKLGLDEDAIEAHKVIYFFYYIEWEKEKICFKLL